MKKRLKSCHFRDHPFTILKMVQTELPRFFLVNCDSAVPGFESSWLVSSNFPMRLVMDWLILVSKDDDVRTSWVSGYPSLLRSFTVSATLCEGGVLPSGAAATAAAARFPGQHGPKMPSSQGVGTLYGKHLMTKWILKWQWCILVWSAVPTL